MSKPTIFVTALIVVSVSVMLACGGSSSNAPPATGSGAYVYATNAGGSVTGFSIDASSGALSPVAGSPFIGPISSQGAAATPDGQYLFVTSSRNNTVNGYVVDRSTGALTGMGLTPPYQACFGGYTDLQPMNTVVNSTGTVLYTQNQQGTISAFSIDATGCLTAIAGSPFRAGTLARGLAIDRTNSYLYVINELGVNVFAINANGSLSQRSQFPFSPTLVSIQTSPTSDMLFAGDGGAGNQVYAFNIYMLTGDLISVATSPTVNPDGTPAAFAMDPQGKYLFIANKLNHSVGAYSVDSTGKLTAVSGSPFTTGSGPGTLSVDPSGLYLFVGNTTGVSVQSFKIGSTGELTPVSTVSTPTNPVSLVAVRRR